MTDIVGGGGMDTLEGSNASNAVVIDSLNGGTLTVGTTITFSEVETVDGRDGDDSFTVTATGDVDGSLIGGDGVDDLIGSSDDEVFNVTTPGGGTLTRTGLVPATLTFTTMENLDGGDGDDTFDIDATLDGNINSGVGDDIFDIAADVGGSLNGGVGDDTFTVAAVVAGDLNGGSGTDTLTLVDPNGQILGTVSNVSVLLDVPGTVNNDTITVGLDSAGVLQVTVDDGINPPTTRSYFNTSCSTGPDD